MRIEIAREGRMDMSGKGLLRAIQNDNMPLLDLFVRESVQNSLDAYRKDSEVVFVDFGVREFNNEDLACELEGIRNNLLEQYSNKECKYLFVRDRGTEGLTGPLHFTEHEAGEKRNLLKLVYEIAKPQESKDSGGSWGYGKTIYFRMGIGLVIYYSRVKTDNGRYQSRLAACLVEDENKRDALLKNPELNSRRGLAWWGKEYHFKSGSIEETGTIPETSEEKISNILSIFGFEEFSEDETGTAIIIPYINEDSLLRNNISTDSRMIVPWSKSISEYIKIAVQRWYIGRLNNPIYSTIQKQPWLRVAINGIGLSKLEISEPFAKIQELYNMALTGAKGDKDFFCEPIKLRNYFEREVAGHIAYKMFSPEEMGMNPPINNPSPFIFVKNENGQDDYKDGDIILTYFRKPGMAVTYDTCGEWVNRIKCNNENTGNILIAVFVLNSGNRFKNDAIKELETIEDYFRASEKADHAAWFDINVNDVNPRLLNKIQQGVRKRINETYKEPITTTEEKSSSLSKMFGEFLLPPQGFGKRACRVTKGSEKYSEGILGQRRNVRLTVKQQEAQMKNRILTLPIIMEIERPVDNVILTLEVAADGNSIPIAHWEEKTGIEVPFFIKHVTIHGVWSEKKQIAKKAEFGGKRVGVGNKSLKIGFERNLAGVNYGIYLTSEYKKLKLSAELQIEVNDITAQMKYKLKEGE